MPFAPRVSSAGMFNGVVGPLVDALNGGDPHLSSLQVTIAHNVADGLDATYGGTVGVAAAVTANNGGLGNDQTANQLVDNGGNAEWYRQSVLGYLPQPDAPIDGDFREFPDLGSGHPGNGGVDGDPNPGKD